MCVAPEDRDKFEKYLTERLDGAHIPPHLSVQKAAKLELVWEGSELHIDDDIWPQPSPNGKPASSAAVPAMIEITLAQTALELVIPS